MATLGFSATYPVGRPAFFAVRFLCHVLRRGLAYEVGTDALAILTLVSTAEDRCRYTKPISFWNDHLCGMLGLSRDRFFAARKKLVERGWLAYSIGARGRAPTYFVTVPGGDSEIDSSILGESHADEVTQELGRISRPICPPIPDSIDHQSTAQFPTPSILFPSSENPPPPSPAEKREEEGLGSVGGEVRNTEAQRHTEEVSSEFIAHRRLNSHSPCPPCLCVEPSSSDSERIEQLRAVGVTFASECLSINRVKLAQLGLPASRFEEVIQWLESRRMGELLPYGGGAVNRRLTNVDLLVLPAGEGWPQTENADWALAWGRDAERRRRDAERTQEQSELARKEQSRLAETEKYTQLEFQFRPELERLRSDREAIAQLLAGGSETDQVLVSLARQQGLGSKLVRRAVLRCLAALAG